MNVHVTIKKMCSNDGYLAPSTVVDKSPSKLSSWKMLNFYNDSRTILVYLVFNNDFHPKTVLESETVLV